MMQIELKNISKSFRHRRVLKDVSLSADGGRCIGIVGANGSGKSTLLSILSGVLRADSGQFLYRGKDMLSDHRLRSELIGYVPQGTPLMEELTVWDNLLLWYDKKQAKQELQSGILKLLDIDSCLKMPVRKLSGGMKKRLSIGCAMAKHPPILLLDEPTAALDLICKKKITEYLHSYKKAGGLVILTTHDVMEIAHCDECYILRDGALHPYVFDGDIENLLGNL